MKKVDEKCDFCRNNHGRLVTKYADQALRKAIMTKYDIDFQLRPNEAAKRLGICRAQFWNLAKKDPDFPPLTRIGRTTSVSLKALEQYVISKTGNTK